MKKRILLVDDDEKLRKMYREILRRNDFETETAENGLASLELFRPEKYDLILLDLKMPVMDGVGNVEGDPKA